jgi:hypothetical protein
MDLNPTTDFIIPNEPPCPLETLLERVDEMRKTLCERKDNAERLRLFAEFNQELAPYALKLGLWFLYECKHPKKRK